MTISKPTLATAAVLAALLTSAAPAHAATAVIDPVSTKYTMLKSDKNEVSIEGFARPGFFLPEVDDEVLL